MGRIPGQRYALLGDPDGVRINLDACSRSPAQGNVADGYGAIVPRLVGINHVALEAGDIDEALQGYGKIFELDSRGRMGNAMAFVDMGDQFIAFSAWAGRSLLTSNATSASSSTTRRPFVRRSSRRAFPFLRRPGSTSVTHGVISFQIVDYRDVQFTKAPRGPARHGPRHRQAGEGPRRASLLGSVR